MNNLFWHQCCLMPVGFLLYDLQTFGLEYKLIRRFVVSLAVALYAISGSAGAATVFSNFNGFGVASVETGGAMATSPGFTLGASTDITHVDIYVASQQIIDFAGSGVVHFLNTTSNVTTDINVSLAIGPTSYPPLFTEWLSYSGLTTLAAGDYLVSVDQALSTEWAQNGGPTTGSFGNGFLQVFGDPTPPASVPEPASLALLGLALAGMGVARRKKA